MSRCPTPVVLVAAAALAAAAPAKAAPAEIRGRALVEGKPAPGVTVSVLPFEDGLAEARREARGEALPPALAIATTRSDGTFAVALPAAAGAAVRVAFEGGRAAPVVLDRLLDAAGEDAGDVRLPRAQALAGRVTDERGGPVVGATVTLWPGRARGLLESTPASGVPQTATTKPDGTFRFDDAGEDGNRLRVEALAMATVEREGVRAGALARPVVLSVGQARRGTVTLADRRTPAGGALVRFEGRTRTRWVEARADGTFLLDGAPREAGVLVADAGDRGRGSSPVGAAASETVALVLAPTAVLSGRVVDEDTARPIAGVRLVARAPSGASSFVARSGADGRYALRGLPPQTYRLAAEDDRYVAFFRNVTVAAGTPAVQDVPLVRAATLVGRVVAEDGTPIEGASVLVTPPGENLFAAFVRRLEAAAEVRTGKDGVFRATRLRPGDGQRVDVRHESYAERSVAGLSLAPGATRSGVTIVMRRGLALRGVAKDEEGRPLAGVEVTLSATRNLRAGRGGMQLSMIGPGSQVRRETGEDGRFEFQGLKAGEYSLSARRAGLGRAGVDPVKVSEGETEPVTLVLRPGATVTGVVHDRSGAGAPGWIVTARPSGQSGPAFGPDAVRTEEATGPDGTFLLEGLAAGETYDLQAMGNSGLGPRKAGVAAPADGIDLTVSGTGQIRGRVVDAESGRPIPDFEVRYQPDAQGGVRFVMRTGAGRQRGPYERMGFHAEDGAFTLDEVPAGRWTVEAFAPGFQSGSAAGVAVAEGDVADGVEVRLSRGNVVSGRVLESRSGRPVLGATVRAELSGGETRMVMVRMGNEGGELEALTDADGRYEIAGLAPGTWTLTANHPDWSDATARVEIKEAPAVADIRMGRGGSVAGGVLAGGRPVSGAQVVLQAAGDSGFRMSPGMLGGGEQSAMTDEGGRFRFDRLTPGRYSVVASLRDETSSPAEAVVTGDDTQEVQLTLAEGARVRGVVSGLPENQLAGVNVSASGGDYYASTRTGAGGTFELTGVPEGTLAVRATVGDMFLGSSRSASTTVTIGPGQLEATGEIVFEGGFRVDGRVTRGGRPVVDATVMANPETGGGRATAASRTDESGGYTLEGLQEGRYSISAMSSDSAPIRKSVEIAGDTTVDLEAPPARIAGVVVEAESGRPLSDVGVRIEDSSPGARFMTMASTDSTGRFTFEDLEPRAYRVAFQKPAYQAETRELTASEDAEVRVELRRGEGIDIEARDGIYATPLRGLFVRVVDAAGQAAFGGSVSLDGDGRGEVPALKPGSYELRAESQGYAPVRVSVAVPSSTIPITLTPGGSLEIQVGPQTLALPEPFGRLLGLGGQPYLPSVFSTDGRIGLASAARRLENIAPGRYVLEVQGGVRRDVTVTEGGRSTVVLP